MLSPKYSLQTIFNPVPVLKKENIPIERLIADSAQTEYCTTWQKWVELTVAKMVGAHHCKNGWSWCYRDSGKNGLSSLWQKWVALTVVKMGGIHHGKNG